MDKNELLKSVWGYDSFRNPQAEIIDAILAEKDVIALLPTGGGKSICYQIPALLKPGICLVVSPLISLMHDQVEGLRQKNIKAVALTSGMSRRTLDIQLENAINDPNLKFLYVSPERLKTQLFKERFKRMNVSLIAVDEAHCISQWGFDFRPAYLDIADIRTLQAEVPIIALTATATSKVHADIIEKLNFKNASEFSTSFERSNLNLQVAVTENKRNDILDFVQRTNGSGIIYCYSRKNTKDVYQWLHENEVSADFYHGGLDQDIRLKKQTDWQSGAIRIMVATNAFGMGIDKADVRFVLHADMPENIESYTQEAGRAGRDGKAAIAQLFVGKGDLEEVKRRITQKYPELDFIKNVYQQVLSFLQVAIGAGEDERYPFKLADYSATKGIPLMDLYNSLKFLELAGFIELSDQTPIRSQFKFTASADELYNQRLANDDTDKFIQFVLRTHIGSTTDMVYINERLICEKLRITMERLGEIIGGLTQRELAIYEAGNSAGSIRLLTERLTIDNLSIPTELYDQRKKLAWDNFESVQNYISTDSCKSTFICEYFGDDSAKACGNCSSCSEERQFAGIEALAEALKKDITANTTVDEVLQANKNVKKEELLEALRILSDQDHIEVDKTGKTIKKLDP